MSTSVDPSRDNTVTGHLPLNTTGFVSYRRNDSCVRLSLAVLSGCSAKCWSPSRTLWSCCSTARCWSGKDRSGPRALRTRTSLSRWWWRSGSPSTLLGCPLNRKPTYKLLSTKINQMQFKKKCLQSLFCTSTILDVKSDRYCSAISSETAPPSGHSN